MDGIQASKSQVKIFEAEIKEQLESDINMWLFQQNNNPMILFINYSTHPTYSAMIIYYEEDNKSHIPTDNKSVDVSASGESKQPGGGGGTAGVGGAGGNQ